MVSRRHRKSRGGGIFTSDQSGPSLWEKLKMKFNGTFSNSQSYDQPSMASSTSTLYGGSSSRRGGKKSRGGKRGGTRRHGKKHTRKHHSKH